MNRLYVVMLAVTCGLYSVSAQGPAPPRLNIPGAIPLGPFPVPDAQFRNDRPVAPLVRIRRPQQVQKQFQQPQQQFQPQPIQRHLDDAKPVSEEREDEEPVFVPHILQQQQQQQIPQQQHLPQFAPNHPNTIPQEQHLTETVRQVPIQQRVSAPAPDRHAQLENALAAQRFSGVPDRQQPQQTPKAAVRRPAFRDASPQYEQPQAQPQPRRSQNDASRPKSQAEYHQNQERDAKPVAQILRKYREENEDGSITWGFENDDGSYKEEFIGIDCVTRGRYGYIDPDGMKREYTYETGIACDPNKRDAAADDDDEELAEGARIPIGNQSVNKARKPANAAYRN